MVSGTSSWGEVGRWTLLSAFLWTLMLSAITLRGASAATTVPCSTCGTTAMDKGAEERYLLEIAKQQILSKLHLRERPNITQTVPRAALMTALRKLHAGRVRQDGTLELDNNVPNSGSTNQAYEIVSFADADDGEDSGTIDTNLSFQFLSDGDGISNRTLVFQRTVDAKRGGWHTFPVTSTLQTFLDSGQRRLRLVVQCEEGGRNLCGRKTPADPSHQPFLVAQVRLRDDGSKHSLSKRSLRCGDDVSVCCKKDFYIKFRDIQWQDWIIAPEGYHMNYCMGQCPQHLSGSPGIASSFHATVFSQLKANGIHTAVSSCCVPIQRRPLSMVYFNSQHTIVKTDVPDMIVESCGCT